MDPFESVKITFFQECEEQLAELESGLLALENGEGDAETINAIFRAVHSVKGGAGAFGFDNLVKFAHVFETTLDHVRAGRLEPDADGLKVMLRAADVLADHVQAAKNGGSIDENRSAVIADELAALSSPANAPITAPQAQMASPSPIADEDDFGFKPLKMNIADIAAPVGPLVWEVIFKPHASMYGSANDTMLLMRELERLGRAKIMIDVSDLPHLDEMDPEEGYVIWRIELETDKNEDHIRDVFDFVDGDCDLKIARKGAVADIPQLPTLPDLSVTSKTLDVDISALLASVRTPDVAALDKSASLDTAAAVEIAAVPVLEPAPQANKEQAKPAAPGGGSAASIRVDLERVDRLIDLVGELVINQAMLAQRVMEAGVARSSTVAMGLDELEQLTREIQDSVMAIRAQPVKSVFQRMPRLVREIALATGKEVRLVTEGENTEVDKTVIERLTDPITHMLRNAIDHGLESPEERVALGKPAEGSVRLSAAHRSGRIIIEVADDGKGINRERVREKAIEKGLISSDQVLTDEEVDNLIFLPGFSTASALSDISGRGVGMDVVKRSIQALGGRIVITSNPGRGSVFTMSLPLTLAVLDGMVVSAGAQTLVVPLTTIVETLQPKANEVRQLGPKGNVLFVRGVYVPMIDVSVRLGWRTEPVDPTTGVVLLVESEIGGRSALLVEGIQGQRQVVIKSLEQNYQRVDGIAAATILGDGRVALILDVDAVIAGLHEEYEAESLPLILEAS